MSASLEGTPEQAIVAALTCNHAGPLLEHLNSTLPSEWSDALCEAALLLGHTPAVSPGEHGETQSSIRASFFAATFRARRALVALDRSARLAVAALEALDLKQEHQRVELMLLQIWRDVVLGESLEQAQFDTLRERAHTHGLSAAVVETTALRALWELREGHPDAVQNARVASRMARTEELPQPASLANVVLARARRLAGGPYLATRILMALRRFSTPPWRRWIDWELALSAGLSRPTADRMSEEARTFGKVLDACRAGDEPAVVDGCNLLRQHESELVRNDVARFQAVALPEQHDGFDDTIIQFIEGRATTVPYGLSGLALTDASGSGALAIVSSDGMRRLNVSAPLLAGAGAVVLTTEQSGHLRSLTAIAILLLARAGLEESELFRRTYGFSYERELHRNAFNVMIHRARTVLGEHATLVRQDERVRIECERTLVVPDPRCALGLRDRLLRIVATTPNATAKQISRDAGLPLRTVQAELKELVHDGVCATARQGRVVEYIVQDTTFHEPTQGAFVSDRVIP